MRDLVAAHKVQCVLAGPLQNKGLVRAVAVDLQIVEAMKQVLDSTLIPNCIKIIGFGRYCLGCLPYKIAVVKSQLGAGIIFCPYI